MKGSPGSTQIVGPINESPYTIGLVYVWGVTEVVKAQAGEGWFAVYTSQEGAINIGDSGIQKWQLVFLLFHK